MKDPRHRLRDIGDARALLDEGAVVPRPAKHSSYIPWTIVTGLGVALAGLAVLHFRETRPERAPVRFQIPPPEKSDYGTAGMALSPDGRTLTFIASAAS